MNLNAAAVASSSDVTHQVFLIAGWWTWRESNPLINRYSIFTTKRRDFSRIMSFDSFLVYQLGNQTQGWTDTLLLTAKVSGFADQDLRPSCQVFLPPHWRQTCPLPPQVWQEYPRDRFPVPLQLGHVFVPVYPMWAHFTQDKGFHPLPAEVSAIDKVL